MTICMSPTPYSDRMLASLSAHTVDAEVRSRFLRLAEQQSNQSEERLYQRQKELFGPDGVFATFSAQVTREGRHAMVFEDVTQIRERQRAKLVERAVNYALARHEQCDAVANPFQGHSREALCCVVYNDCAAYTMVERYAAYEAIRQLDSVFFIKLIATTRGVVERRIVFRGLLEHFDRLLPIEQSIYPGNYREAQQGHLDREEAIYGPLQLDKSLNDLLEEVSPSLLLQLVQTPSDSVD